MANGIIEHHDWQNEPFYEFVRRFLPGIRVPQPTDPDAVQGTITAEVNHGRWICRCPTCAGALIVTAQVPYFLCTDCANISNGGKWYRVRFPAATQKTNIEKILMARPAAHWRLAGTRNWLSSQTLAELRRENLERGLPEQVF